MLQMSLKLGVLVSHPIQYFVPVYRQLALAKGIELTVLYRTRVGVDEYHDEGFGQTVKWDIPLLGGYQHHFLSNKNKIAGIEWGIVAALLHQRFDAVLIHGYNSATNLLAIFIARIIGTKVLMRGDTRWQEHHQRTGLKSLLKRLLFKCCNGFVSIGTLNRAYYLQHGLPSARIFFAPFCVNNEQFAASPVTKVQARKDIRTALQLQADTEIVLFASKLVKRKRTDDLIRAFATLEGEFPTACLVIAGSGDEQASLQYLSESLRIKQIRFVGFQNQTQLPPLYAATDVFVLPSDEEPWGLVINEVMAAGVPVIVSNEVGAAPDLVEGKGTGIVYRCGDVDALSQALRLLLGSATMRKQMADSGVQLIESWSVNVCADGIARAARAVIANAGNTS